MSNADNSTSFPLETTQVVHSLELIVANQHIEGTVRATWGTLEVALTAPVAHLSRRCDYRGWSFAMLAHHRPEERFALAGEMTAKGEQRARAMLEELYRDYLAVQSQLVEVDNACAQTRRELAELVRLQASQSRPLLQKRQEYRRLFRLGEFEQREYQKQLKELRKQLGEIESAHWHACQTIRDRFASWCKQRIGRRMTLEEAERLLSEPALIVPVR